MTRCGLAFYVRKGEVAILVIAPCYERTGFPAMAFMLSLPYHYYQPALSFGNNVSR